MYGVIDESKKDPSKCYDLTIEGSQVAGFYTLEEIPWLPNYVFDDADIYRAAKQLFIFVAQTFKELYMTLPRTSGLEPQVGFHYRTINTVRRFIFAFDEFVSDEYSIRTAECNGQNKTTH